MRATRQIQVTHSAEHIAWLLKQIDVIREKGSVRLNGFKGWNKCMIFVVLNWCGQTVTAIFGSTGKFEYGQYIRWVESLLKWTGSDCSLKRTGYKVTWKSIISGWGKI